MEKFAEALKAMNLNVKGDVLLNTNLNTYLTLHTPDTSALIVDGNDTLHKSLTEIDALNEIKTLIRRGKDFIRYIYCYRNISVAIPMNMIEMKTEEETRQYYESIQKVLEPKIEKMSEIKSYVDKTSAFVADNCVEMFGSNFHTVEIQIKLVILIDTLVSISYLVGSKSSLINDFTRLKRENSLYVKKFQGENLSEKINDLQNFFSSPNYTAETLQAKFNTLKNVENLLYDIMSFAMDLVEGGRFYSTEDRLSFLRTIVYLVFLIDSPSHNFFKGKHKNFSRFKKHAFRYAFLPLCMDLNISVRIVLSSCKNVGDINKLDWIDACDVEYYKLANHIPSVKSKIIEYTIRFQSFLLKISSLPPKIDEEKAKDHIQTATTLYNLLIEGIDIISDLQQRIFLQICYKMENRISEEQFKKLEEQEAQNTNPDLKLEEEEKLRGDAKLFQRKVRYNFASEDLNAMLEAINLLKDLSHLFSQNEEKVVDHIYFFYYHHVQNFLQTVMIEIQHEKKLALEFLKQIDDVLYFVRDFNINESEKNKKSKKSLFKLPIIRRKKSGNVITDRRFRMAFPSDTQMYAMRYIAEKIVSMGKKKLMKDKDHLKASEYLCDILHNFYNLTNLRSLIDSISDLSFLWFKEFNLAFSNCIQFPVELCLPGILSDYAVTKARTVPQILRVFDIYNDSGKMALKVFKQRYIYEEVEAECSLVFDQFLYNFSRTFLNEAINIEALKHYPSPNEVGLWPEVRTNSGINIFEKLCAIAMYKEISILGRKIDLNMLLAQQLNSHLREVLDYIITKFENMGITNILELQLGLKLFKTICNKLQKIMPVDSYERIFEEINESVGIGNFQGRVFTALNYNLLMDFCENFVYRSGCEKFERTSWVNVDQGQYEDNAEKFDKYDTNFGTRFSKYYKNYFAQKSQTVTYEHLEAIINTLSPVEISYAINEATHFGKEKLLKKLKPYFDALKSAIPIMKAPSATFGFPGGHAAIELKLSPISKYPPLRSKVFQALKAVGNTFVLAYCLDVLVQSRSVMNHLSTAFLYGTTYETIDFEVALKEAGGEGPALKALKGFARPEKNLLGRTMEAMAEAAAGGDAAFGAKARAVAASVERYEEFNARGSQKTLLAGMVYSYTISLYESSFVGDFQGQFYHEPGTGLASKDDLASILNAVKFVFCNSKGDKNVAVDDHGAFGDSLVWASAALTVILNQDTRYRVTDYCDYLYKLNKKDAASAPAAGKSKASRGLITMSEQSINFIEMEENYKKVHDTVSNLIRQTYKVPNRYIQTENKDGEVDWKEDVYLEKYAKII